MPYEFVSAKKKTPNQGRAVGKGAYLLVFKMDDVKVFTRDDKGVKVSAFELIAGKKPIGVYHVDSTLNVFQTSTGETGSRGWIHNTDLEIPGTEIEVDEFMENNSNEKLGVICVPCDGTDCRIAGTKGTPLEITQDNTEDSAKKRAHNVQLKSLIPGPVLGHIAKALVPSTGDAAIDAILGLPAAEQGI